MRSFIKIYGPPIVKSIKALEKIAVGMPQVCISNTLIEQFYPAARATGAMIGHEQPFDWTFQYFSSMTPITVERCNNIISESRESLGEYDFYFEWFTEPTIEQLNQFLEKIDETLAPIGCRYTVTTKK